MKKNFKKSKFVILPALATLVLTSVATVTGTAAWFSASRSVIANAGDFVAKNLSGNFTIQATGGVGTTATEDEGVTNSRVTVNANTVMTDASYDIHSDVLYTKVLGDDAVTGYKVIGTTGKYATLNPTNLKAGSYTETSTTKVVFYALTWSYTFTYEFKDTTKTMDLFLDSAGASFTKATGGTLTDSGKGFRIGFIGDKKTILSADNETTHVTGTTTTADDYSKEDVKYLGVTSQKAGDVADESNKSRDDYLGTFKPTTDGTSITLNVIAWFEGTDKNVVNEKDLEAVTCTFGFYAREGAAVSA